MRFLTFVSTIVSCGLVLQVDAIEQVGTNTKGVTKRTIAATLFLDNPFDGGDWGYVATCPEGTFSHAFEVLFMPPGQLDETAINGLRLYCSTEEGHDEGYVESSNGPEGSYYGMKICDEGFLTGFRGKVLEYQGVFTDDVAVQDFEMECRFGMEILPGIYDQQDRYNEGDWSSWAQCPYNTAVCGLQTRLESPQLTDDDTAITDVNLFCCERSSGNGTALLS